MKKYISLILVLSMVVSLFVTMPMVVSGTETWLWPVSGYYNISSGYGQRSSGWHKGIDIDESYVGNITGKPAMATRGGTATVYWGYNGGAGNYVVINHGDGYVSRYLHLDSIAISNGNVVKGQTIGYVGNTGDSSGPHLHFDIKYNGAEVNPMPVNYDNRHTYKWNSAEVTQNIRYDYNVVHTHSFWLENEATHPHREYRRCSCGHTEYTGNTATISTCSQCSAPGKPSLENMWEAYLTDDGGETAEIMFSWLATTNTTHYNLFIDRKNDAGDYEYFQEELSAKNGVKIELYEGEYRVQLQSVNSNANWSYTDSDWYYFEVSNVGNISWDNSFENHTYTLIDSGAYWNNARSWCRKYGGHLATINSEEEFNFLVDAIARSGKTYYIGGTDKNSEGNWEWVTGEDWDYDGFWNIGEPNNSGGGEHYMTLGAMANDVPATSKYGFICEIENTCGENLTWSLDDEGTLTISGIGAMDNYNAWDSSPWHRERLIIEKVIIKDDVTSIGDFAFRGCSYLEEVVLPQSLKTIGSNAFEGCQSLSNIILPDGIERIGDNAFQNCESLTEIIIPEGTTVIEMYTFDGCSSLTDITIHEGVYKIEPYAFSRCDNLSNVYYRASQENWNEIAIWPENENLTNATIHFYKGVCGDNLTWEYIYHSENWKVLALEGTGDMYDYDKSVSGKADWSVFDIDYIVINPGITSIGDYAFYGLMGNIEMTKSVTKIGEGAFYGSALPIIWLPKNLTLIEKDAFYGCTNLVDVYYEGSQEEWNKITIESGNECLTNATIHFEGGNSVSATGVSLDKSSINMITDATETLTATVLPLDATNKNVSWTSSNTSVASVSNGVVTANAAGTAIITVTTEDSGYTASCSVVVDDKNTYFPGDINGDGIVGTKDITVLRRYIAGGYDVIVVDAALDVNRDEVITTKDVTALRRFIAGGYGIELD